MLRSPNGSVGSLRTDRSPPECTVHSRFGTLVVKPAPLHQTSFSKEALCQEVGYAEKRRTFYHGVQLGGHGHDDALRCLAIPLTPRELEDKLAVGVLIRRIFVVQLLERLKLGVQEREMLSALGLR